MYKEFRFVYQVTQIGQDFFDDYGKPHTHTIDTFEEGHILYQGSWMCGERMKKGKKIKYATRTQRIDGIKICQECQERYKANLDSAWQKWVSGQSIESGKTLKMIDL